MELWICVPRPDGSPCIWQHSNWNSHSTRCFLAHVIATVLLWAMARFSPYEWGTTALPCIEDPEELENCFNLSNSFFFLYGTFIQQGADVAPAAPSTRWIWYSPGLGNLLQNKCFVSVTNQHPVGWRYHRGTRNCWKDWNSFLVPRDLQCMGVQ